MGAFSKAPLASVDISTGRKSSQDSIHDHNSDSKPPSRPSSRATTPSNEVFNGTISPGRVPLEHATNVKPPSGPPSRPTSRTESRLSPPPPGPSTSALHPSPSSASSAASIHSHAAGRPLRFEVFKAGTPQETHEHHLRPARRQEKLTRMLKDLFRGHAAPGSDSSGDDDIDKDSEDAIAAIEKGPEPPSLLGGLIKQLRQDKRDPGTVLEELMSARSKADGNSSFSQRYGQLSSVVGKGSFGVVRLASKINPADRRRKLVYAVKEFRPNSGEGESTYLKRLASEFCLSSSLHHPNIIHTLDLLRDPKGQYCGVMEYCAGGDLYSLIVVAGKLETKEADCYFKQTMRAVSYMHDMGVAHRDLKPENVLLTSRGAVKITDFGNAECFRMAWEKEIHMATTICGSGPYIAPEEYTKSQFDPRAVDVWSVGVIYLAMRTGRHLWHEAKPCDDFYATYLRGRKDENGYEPIETLESNRRRNVIYSMLDPVASRRLTARQVLKSEWGREIIVCDAGEGKRLEEEHHVAAKTAAAMGATVTPTPMTSSPVTRAASPTEVQPTIPTSPPLPASVPAAPPKTSGPAPQR